MSPVTDEMVFGLANVCGTDDHFQVILWTECWVEVTKDYNGNIKDMYAVGSQNVDAYLSYETAKGRALAYKCFPNYENASGHEMIRSPNIEINGSPPPVFINDGDPISVNLKPDEKGCNCTKNSGPDCAGPYFLRLKAKRFWKAQIINRLKKLR